MSQKYKKLLKGIERWAKSFPLKSEKEFKHHTQKKQSPFVSEGRQRIISIGCYIRDHIGARQNRNDRSVTLDLCGTSRFGWHLRSFSSLPQQVWFSHLESAQNASLPPAMLNIPLSTWRHSVNVSLVQCSISVSEGQILWHKIRHRRQAHSVRPTCWCL